ncbi:hypothetical protein B0H21DRAFT_825673 [Amylocystis lapponica]|nr:hypothetical protein B0H21DRAFT_825673 [Amylocystis lapponica]
MDQESFRKLLHAPGAPRSTPSARGSLLPAPTKQKKPTDPAKPAFKPRTLKKQPDGPYRDRASERQALAADFERRHAEEVDRLAVEEQRRFLGGDSAHTVLVKGLDLALLAQNRARAAADAAVVDDASLERAFREAEQHAPRKRTREEIVQELKSKRAKRPADAAADAPLEDAKNAGKFRPIGVKPVGGEKKKAAKGERRNKRKAEPVAAPGPSTPPLQPAPAPALAPEPEPEPVDEDFDIFADAGEYTGVDVGEDDDESESEQDDERPRSRSRSRSAPRADPVPLSDAEDGEEEEERPVRLQPLASSALPSIRDLLAMDSAADKGKRRTRKNKKKDADTDTDKDKDKREAGAGKVSKDKIERDYKRLKAYTDKKAASGKTQ